MGTLKSIVKKIVWWDLPLEINLISDIARSETLGMTLERGKLSDISSSDIPGDDTIDIPYFDKPGKDTPDIP